MRDTCQSLLGIHACFKYFSADQAKSTDQTKAGDHIKSADQIFVSNWYKLTFFPLIRPNHLIRSTQVIRLSGDQIKSADDLIRPAD